MGRLNSTTILPIPWRPFNKELSSDAGSYIKHGTCIHAIIEDVFISKT